MPRIAPTLAIALLPALAGACLDRSVTEIVPIPEHTENLEFSVELNHKLDILFVIDDSKSMEREQDQIAENFHRMIEVLETLPTGLPDLHLGVVSTDVGAGEACGAAPSPGAGVLRNRPMVAGCSAPSDRWISDVDDGAGGRIKNYSGALADSFSCIATLGTEGCGFEQPLEAMRLALSPENLLNEGFLRDDAVLAVVLLTDEDDCSVFDDQIFTLATDEPFGPIENFRCFEHGIDCEGIDPRTPGARENCVPRSDSEYLTPVEEFAAMLHELRPLESRLVVAGIMGDAGPIRIGTNERDHLDVLRSCDIGTDDPQGAFPPIRTDAFLAQFADPVRKRICDADLSPAIAEVADRIKLTLYGRCILGELTDVRLDVDGLQAECSITEIQHPGRADEAHDILPQCAGDPATSAEPCWYIDVNTEICTTTDEHLEVATFYPEEERRDADTIIQAQCRMN